METAVSFGDFVLLIEATSDKLQSTGLPARNYGSLTSANASFRSTNVFNLFEKAMEENFE